jgi:hypothetical protein
MYLEALQFGDDSAVISTNGFLHICWKYKLIELVSKSSGGRLHESLITPSYVWKQVDTDQLDCYEWAALTNSVDNLGDLYLPSLVDEGTQVKDHELFCEETEQGLEQSAEILEDITSTIIPKLLTVHMLKKKPSNRSILTLNRINVAEIDESHVSNDKSKNPQIFNRSVVDVDSVQCQVRPPKVDINVNEELSRDVGVRMMQQLRAHRRSQSEVEIDRDGNESDDNVEDE